MAMAPGIHHISEWGSNQTSVLKDNWVRRRGVSNQGVLQQLALGVHKYLHATIPDGFPVGTPLLKIKKRERRSVGHSKQRINMPQQALIGQACSVSRPEQLSPARRGPRMLYTYYLYQQGHVYQVRLVVCRVYQPVCCHTSHTRACFASTGSVCVCVKEDNIHLYAWMERCQSSLSYNTVYILQVAACSLLLRL